MELFNNSDTADGYSSNRPYFHPIVINKVKERLGLTKRLKKGLDVGCGAGLSSIALLEITQNVVGFDSSAFMISSAIKSDRIIYLNYSAEDMPIDQQYDIITLSGSINWIDRNLFFARSLHVLKSQGYIVIYDNDILGEMVGEPSFTYWYHNIFLNVYPRPPRNESLLENELLNRYGFKVEYSERYTNRIRFNLECFIELSKRTFESCGMI